ncbi:WavE lipopolysaccharide synthesis family protein, partial [Shewanella sp. 4t3-1-2LB]|uniref:WavE lipopolysaccharide synthesis family protein n=1 Tax=Shewanella sp. 4t3-1-2LB TaxID=2817682 RepID=UPI001F61ED0C
MVHSTSSGLESASTNYAVKMRTDFWFDDFSDFAEFYKNKENAISYLNEGLIQHIMMCIGANALPNMPYLISDFWQFGLVEDMIKLWSDATFDASRLSSYPRSKSFYRKLFQISGTPENTDAPFNSEQLLCENICKKLSITFPNNYIEASSYGKLLQSYKV